MAGRLETAKNYLTSLAERTIGVSDYKQMLAKGESRRLALLGFGLQLTLPATTRVITEQFHPRESVAEVFKGLLAVHWDAATILSATLPSLLSHNPFEFTAYYALSKLAANAATHVGLDVINAGVRGVNRLLRNFRPSATTPTI